MASKRHQRRKACGKVRYATQLAALIGARKMGVHSATPYHCRNCGSFHWGHTPAAVADAIAARRGE